MGLIRVAAAALVVASATAFVPPRAAAPPRVDVVRRAEQPEFDRKGALIGGALGGYLLLELGFGAFNSTKS